MIRSVFHQMSANPAHHYQNQLLQRFVTMRAVLHRRTKDGHSLTVFLTRGTDDLDQLRHELQLQQYQWQYQSADHVYPHSLERAIANHARLRAAKSAVHNPEVQSTTR